MHIRSGFLAGLCAGLSLLLLGHRATAQEEGRTGFLAEAGAKVIFRLDIPSEKVAVQAVWGHVERKGDLLFYTAPSFRPPEGRDAIAVTDEGSEQTYTEEILIQNAPEFRVRASPLSIERGMDPDGDGYYEVAIDSEEERRQCEEVMQLRGETMVRTMPPDPEFTPVLLIEGDEAYKLPADVWKWLDQDEAVVSDYTLSGEDYHCFRQVGKRKSKPQGVKFPFFPRPATCNPNQNQWEVVGPWSPTKYLGLIGRFTGSFTGAINANWLAELRQRGLPLPPVNLQGGGNFNVTYTEYRSKVKRSQQVDVWRCKNGQPVWVTSYHRVQYGTFIDVSPVWMGPALGGGWTNVLWGPVTHVK